MKPQVEDIVDVIPTQKPRRRTQEERSHATRVQVCDATLDMLSELGYEQISTTMIAKKANVSRGALTHQFPTRNQLLVAAYQHLVDGWGEIYPLGEDYDVDRFTIQDMIDVYWDNIFSTKRYIAALELMLAARQDNELGRSLREVMESWIKKRDAKTLVLLWGEVSNESNSLYFQLVLSVLRGIAVHQSFDQDETVAPQLLEMWKRIAHRVEEDPMREELITGKRLSS